MANSPRLQWPVPDVNTDPWYDAFIALVNAQDASAYANREDRQIIMTKGGNFTFVSSSGVLTWTANLEVLSGISGYIETLPSGAITLLDGQVMYLNLTRAPVNTITISAVAANFVPNTDSAYAFAVRRGADVYFRNGQKISNGDAPTEIFGYGSGGGGSADLQDSYSNGSAAAAQIVVMDNTRNGVILRDNSPSVTGSLFAVQDHTGAINILAASTSAVSVGLDVNLANSADRTIQVTNSSGATAGKALTLKSGNGGGTSGAGGTVNVTAGDGGPASNAGDVAIQAGRANNNDGTGGNPAFATFHGGQTDGTGGELDLNSGNPSSGSNKAGGDINVTAANGHGSGSGGQLAVTAGNGGASGVGGFITITSGNSGASQAGGNISLFAGDGGSSADGGAALIKSGNANQDDGSGGASASILLDPGSAGGVGAQIQVNGGAGGTTGDGGAVTINAGNGGPTSGAGGLLSVNGGNGGPSSSGGDINAGGGLSNNNDGSGGNPGNGVFQGGQTDGTGGAAQLFGGNGCSMADGFGGPCSLTGGSGTGNGDGGSIGLNAGSAIGSGGGGHVTAVGGDGGAEGANGGNITLTGGTGVAGGTNGGDIGIHGGNGTLKNGKVELTGREVIISVPTSAPADGELANGEVTFWVDEGSDKLMFKVKYSGGTVKSGFVSLT